MIVHIQYLIEAAKIPVIFIKLSESICRVAFHFIVLFWELFMGSVFKRLENSRMFGQQLILY